MHYCALSKKYKEGGGSMFKKYAILGFILAFGTANLTINGSVKPEITPQLIAAAQSILQGEIDELYKALKENKTTKYRLSQIIVNANKGDKKSMDQLTLFFQAPKKNLYEILKNMTAAGDGTMATLGYAETPYLDKTYKSDWKNINLQATSFLITNLLQSEKHSLKEILEFIPWMDKIIAGLYIKSHRDYTTTPLSRKLEIGLAIKGLIGAINIKENFLQSKLLSVIENTTKLSLPEKKGNIAATYRLSQIVTNVNIGDEQAMIQLIKILKAPEDKQYDILKTMVTNKDHIMAYFGFADTPLLIKKYGSNWLHVELHAMGKLLTMWKSAQ